MTRTRSFALIAALAASALAVPATAQPGGAMAGPPPGGTYNGTWQGGWQGPDNRVYRGTWSGTVERGGPNGSVMDGAPMPDNRWGPDVGPDAGPPPPGAAYPGQPYPGQPYPGNWGPPQRDPEFQRMMERCSRNHSGGKIGGAAIGGVVGGIVGNRVGGRGNRTLGTVAGAAIGAAGGAAVGSGLDRRSDRECEDFFRQAGPAGPGGYYPGGAYPDMGGYPGNWAGAFPYGYVMVPVMIQGGSGQRGYTETTVTETEYVEGSRYRGGHKIIYRRPVIHRAPPRRVHDKRVYIGGGS